MMWTVTMATLKELLLGSAIMAEKATAMTSQKVCSALKSSTLWWWRVLFFHFINAKNSSWETPTFLTHTHTHTHTHTQSQSAVPSPYCLNHSNAYCICNIPSNVCGAWLWEWEAVKWQWRVLQHCILSIQSFIYLFIQFFTSFSPFNVTWSINICTE